MVASQAPHPEVPHDLTLAVIASSISPLLLLDGGFAILVASGSFYRAFQIDPANGTGREIFALGAGEWDIRQLRSLLKATAGGDAQIDAYEMDLVRDGLDTRRLVLNVQKLAYGDADNIRLLLAIVDVTDARLADQLKTDMLREKDEMLREKESLVREKAILLQELQHRVANSLQIIASVLLQSARRVASDETRTHLYDAHQRVMSVAAVQKQLATTTLGDVTLRAYFTELCQSIGASMIRDHNQLSLDVVADDSLAGPDISVSLGLIVTELVINALKHAFPGHRPGKITVAYRSDGPDWTLSVGDDGVGMPKDPSSAKTGLGTSIVHALAQQLQAEVESVDTQPGHKVSVIHSHDGAKAA